MATTTDQLPVFEIAPGVVVDGRNPVFILGPCVIESEAFVRSVAERLVELSQKLGLQLLFKASFDKANRTSLHSFRGPGAKQGMAILAAIKNDLGIPVTSDIHEPDHAAMALDAGLDLVQIPAFLCRQTDLLVAAAKTGLAVNVKKGQFLAPWDMKNVIHKLQEAGCQKILLTERGSTFGYNNLVVDMRSLVWMRELGQRVCFDATHSVQRPGGMGGSTGGDGALAPVLARAAIAVGVDAIFMETHPNPGEALSDGPNQVPLDSLESTIQPLLNIHRALLSQS